MRAAAALAFGLVALACGPEVRGRYNPPVPPSSVRGDAKQGEGTMAFARESSAPRDATWDETGQATWYGGAFAGKKTASGEPFDPTKLTAAHRKLPFGTWVEVRRVDTGRTIRVRINDRGPWGDERRVLDLSRKAADDLGILRDGVVRVQIRVVDGP